MTFGFSYVGLIYLVMLFVPNFFWTKNKPKGYEKFEKNENKALLLLERAGEVLVSCAAVVFSDFNLKPWTPWSWWLAASFLAMLLYEVWWLRYFRSEKNMRDFYSGILGIPVAGATLPVSAFFLLGIYGKNPLLTVSSVILGIGHIGIHLAHRREAAAKDG